MIDETTARYLYRTLLDRDPENEQVIRDLVTSGKSLKQLCSEFLSSPEFRVNNPTVGYDLKGHAYAITSLGGLVYVDLADYIVGMQILLGAYEREETEWMKKNIKRGWHVIDIGANCGYFTSILSQLVGPFPGHVTAIEPVPATFAMLEKTFLKLSLQNSSLKYVAVGNAPGKITIVVDDATHNYGGSHFADGRGVPPGSSLHECSVDTLDEIMQPWHPIQFIKIDIEGAEPFAFEGMTGILKACRPIIMAEVNPVALRCVAGWSPKRFYDYIIEEMKYRPTDLDGNELVAFPDDRLINVILRPME